MDGARSAGGSARTEIAEGQVFYRFTDANGREHIVNAEEGVPPAQRDVAQRIVLERPDPWRGAPLDPKSVVVGVGAGLVVGMLASFLLRARGPLTKIVVMAACGAGLALAYFGLVRRSVGLGNGGPISPQSLVDDAKRAVETMNSSVRERDEQIRRLQQEAK